MVRDGVRRSISNLLQRKLNIRCREVQPLSQYVQWQCGQLLYFRYSVVGQFQDDPYLDLRIRLHVARCKHLQNILGTTRCGHD